MLSAEDTYRFARCINVAVCPRAAAAEPVEWYLGAGEYCPECGETLAATRSTGHEVRPLLTAVDRLMVPPTARETGYVVPFRWF
jgi:hypothetical protein